MTPPRRTSGRRPGLLAAIEDGLPLVPRPYRPSPSASALPRPGSRAAARLLERGVIRRLGVVVRHHELGYRANAMVVWDVPDDQVDRSAGTWRPGLRHPVLPPAAAAAGLALQPVLHGPRPRPRRGAGQHRTPDHCARSGRHPARRAVQPPPLQAARRALHASRARTLMDATGPPHHQCAAGRLSGLRAARSRGGRAAGPARRSDLIRASAACWRTACSAASARCTTPSAWAARSRLGAMRVPEERFEAVPARSTPTRRSRTTMRATTLQHVVRARHRTPERIAVLPSSDRADRPDGLRHAEAGGILRRLEVRA